MTHTPQDQGRGSSGAEDRLAISAHEIRNPAQALIGLTDMLCAMALPPDAQACAKVIRQSAQAILAVVDNAIDLVRLQKGFIDFVAEPFDPRALIAGCVEILYGQAAAKGLDLAGFSDPALPPRVVGDAARVRQVLLNLAGNAIKFTEEGGVGLAVRQEADGTLAFIVEDTGPGFAEGDRAALFAAFASTGYQQGGLGLGLTVSAGIAGALGGTLSLDARTGGGSRFVLRLPCPAVPDDPPASEIAYARRPVLIVSAGAFTGPYLEEKLRLLGHETGLIARPERAGLWLSEHPDAAMLVDAALGRRGVSVASHRAIAAGCKAIALLRSVQEGATLGTQATCAWPSIRKPVAAHAVSLKTASLGQERGGAIPEAAPLALVAEDCPVNRLLAERLLQLEGYRVIVAADGIEAIDQIAQRIANGEEPFVLILIDMRMPGFDGLMTTRQIRAMETVYRAPRAFICGISAEIDNATLQACSAEGMDEIVTKPLTAEALAAIRGRVTGAPVVPMSEHSKTRGPGRSEGP